MQSWPHKKIDHLEEKKREGRNKKKERRKEERQEKERKADKAPIPHH